jgi:serine/threonine protein kinase
LQYKTSVHISYFWINEEGMAEVELQQIGPYTITQLLREGSTSSFYLGKQPRKKDVIIKRLRIPLTTPESKEAFLSRAKQLKKLKDRAIVAVQDANFEGDYGYIVMEAVNGVSLRERIPPGKCLAPDEVKRYLSPIANALHYTHVNNTVHGNLHPDALLIGQDTIPRLSEFSLSMPGIPISLDDEATSIPYMAPEQLRGEASAASDQYALAAMAYEWLCGRRPHEATERDALLQQQEHNLIAAPRTFNEAISSAVELVILQALSYHPNERFQSVQFFADSYLSALV